MEKYFMINGKLTIDKFKLFELTLFSGKYKSKNYSEIFYYKNGKFHREDGPAIHSNNCKIWYKNGKYHRKGEPAVIYSNGTKMWYENGKLHREDGPAFINMFGGTEYWLNGVHQKSVINDRFSRFYDYMIIIIGGLITIFNIILLLKK